MRPGDWEKARAGVAERLRERRPEIEQATLIRIYAVSEPPRGGGPEYAEGLRAAVTAAVGYGLEGIERGEQGISPAPEVLLVQARLAARSGVSLDTVLRRYFAGHALLEDFLVEEIARQELLGPAEMKGLLRSQSAIVERLLAAVSKVYTEEVERRPNSFDQLRAELVERLLDGEPLDASPLAYDVAGWHIGMVASSAAAAKPLSHLAKSLDARLLAVRREEGTLWVWLGFRRRFDPGELEARARSELPVGLALSIGEPGEGITGWRLSHRQARATFPIAQRGGEKVIRCAGNALLASVLQDELLRVTLHDAYLVPLSVERDGGATLRRTLRVYLATASNISSTAISLQVDRKTVAARLRVAEERLQRPIATCVSELETALRLAELAPSDSPKTGIAPSQRPK